jgi:hypothetical protein
LRTQRQEVTSALIELHRLEAQLKAIEKRNGVLLNVNSGAVPFIQIDPNKQQ